MAIEETISELPCSAGGRLFSHYGFEVGSPGVRRRRIYVYQPVDYFEHPRRRFPVLYVLDGQNVLDQSQERAWKLTFAVEKLAQKAAIRTPLVVGIPHSSARLAEYVGWSHEPNHYHPAGDKHRSYVVDQVVPCIERNYRTSKRDRVIAGASAAGVAALYVGLSHPDIFPGVGVFSAGRHYFHELAERFFPTSAPKCKIFLSCGDRGMDEELCPYSKAFASRLRHQHAEFRYRHRPGASHHERFWTAVLPDFLKYMFPVP